VRAVSVCVAVRRIAAMAVVAVAVREKRLVFLSVPKMVNLFCIVRLRTLLLYVTKKKKKKKKKKKEKIFLVELKKHTMQQKKALGLLIRTGRRNRMHCNSHDPKTSDKRPNVRQLLHNVLAAGAAEETRHLSKTNNKFSISI
jgi:exonuclease III